MPNKYAKASLLTRYAKALLLTPAIGSFLVCSLGLLLGVVLLSGWEKSGHGVYLHAGQPIARPGFMPRDFHAASERKIIPVQHRAMLLTSSPGKRSGPHLAEAVFQETIASDQLGFLKEYAGRPAQDVVREASVRTMIEAVVPYAPFHYGIDRPLSRLMEDLFTDSRLPVEVRDGRYMMLLHTNAPGRGREFLWVDAQEGIGVGGIFFYPTNGEPTPTLTLFSRQVKGESLEMSQMPAAFVRDLKQWAATWGVPAITVRYFINGEGEKTVLAHDEDFCAGATQDVCKKINADAADIDMEARYFLGQVHYASNATMRQAAPVE